MSAGWIIGSIALLFVARERLLRRTLAQAEASQAALVRAMPADERQAFLPPERDDLYVVLPHGTVGALVATVFAPAIVLTLAWMVARSKNRAQPG